MLHACKLLILLALLALARLPGQAPSAEAPWLPSSSESGLPKVGSEVDPGAFRLIPVLEGQRFKPLDSLAREFVRTVTWEAKPKGADGKRIDPTTLFLHWIFEPEKAVYERVLRLPGPRARDHLGFESQRLSSAALFVSLREVLANPRYFEVLGEAERGPATQLSQDIQHFHRRVNYFTGAIGLSLDPEALIFVRALMQANPPGLQDSVDAADLYLHWSLDREAAWTAPVFEIPSDPAARAYLAQRLGWSPGGAGPDGWASARMLLGGGVQPADGAPPREASDLLQRLDSFRRRFLSRDDHALRGFLPIVPPKTPIDVLRTEYHWASPLGAHYSALRLKAPMVAERAKEDIERLVGWPPEKLERFPTLMLDLRSAWRADDQAAFEKASTAMMQAVRKLDAPQYPEVARMEREQRYNRTNPFGVAKWLYAAGSFLALLALTLFPRRKSQGRLRDYLVLGVASLPMAIGASLHGWGIWERAALGQETMIGNFFESLLFMSAACAVLAVIGGLWMRNRAILLSGSLLTWPLLMAAIDYHKQWDAKISTLMPVLMSNYWIHIHVPTIIMSYAALGLAFVLGHVYLLTWMINSGARETLRDVSRSIFVMMPVGEVLLAVGIVLGGIWADASWGRFWGWDPKETWSFVTFMVFIVVIHGRWAGWLSNFGTALGTLVGGWFLFWTYWGANFVQKGTLHSYAGASASVEWPTRLVLLGGIELLFVAAVATIWFARGGRFRFGSGHQPGDRALRAKKPEEPAGAGASGGH